MSSNIPATTSENSNSFSMLNPSASKCRIFDGNTCFEWLTFIPEWKAYMAHLGVEEIILKGTYNKEAFHLLTQQCPSLRDAYTRWCISKKAAKIPILHEEFTKNIHEPSHMGTILLTKYENTCRG